MKEQDQEVVEDILPAKQLRSPPRVEAHFYIDPPFTQMH